MNHPPNWPRLCGTVVDPSIAEWVLAAMTNYIRNNGQTLNGEYAAFIHALEADIKDRRGETIAPFTTPVVRWLTMKSAAQRVGVTPEAVRQRAKHGQLVMKKIGRRQFVTQASVDRWCNERADLAEMRAS